MEIEITIGYDSNGYTYIPCRQNRKNGLNIDCSYLKLKTVPKCHQLNVSDCSLIKEMNLKRNLIENITNGSFVEYPNLTHLNLMNNPLKRCDNGAFAGLEQLECLVLNETMFQSVTHMRHRPTTIFADESFTPLKKLKYLDMSQTTLDADAVFLRVFCRISPTLETLFLDQVYFGNGFPSLNSKMSKCFHHIKLKKFSARHNHIVIITPEFVMNFRHLIYLSLRRNLLIGQLDAINELITMSNLTFLDIGCQHRFGCDVEYDYPANIPKFQHTENDYPVNIPKYPHIYGFNATKVKFLPKLQTLRIDHIYARLSRTENIPDVCWSNNHLVELDISYLNFHSVKGKLQCLWNLKFLNARGLRLTHLDPEIFQDLISLRILLMDNALSSSQMLGTSSGSQFLKHNKELVYLELSNNGIHTLYRNVFQNLNKLQFLNLSNNKIENIEHQFENLTSVRHVDLSYNSLTQIPMRILWLLERNLKVNSSISAVLQITGNPFQCSCTLLSQIKLAQHSKVMISYLNSTQDKLYCILQNGTRIPVFKVWKQLESVCYGTMPELFLTFVYPLCLIVITLSTVGYKYRWRVKYAWYTVLHLLNNREQERRNFRFDAFICYSSDDEEWVRKKLVANLESDEVTKYNLCLHYRHFIPGRNITDNIAAAVQESRKTVLVVTKKFLKSGWCDFETRFAHTHHLYRHTSGVIGIIHPEVYKMRGFGGKALDRLLDSVTYLRWPMDKEEERWFWLGLKRALGPPCTSGTDDELHTLVF